MPIALAIEQARSWLGGTLPTDLHGVLTALLAEIDQQRRRDAPPSRCCPECGRAAVVEPVTEYFPDPYAACPEPQRCGWTGTLGETRPPAAPTGEVIRCAQVQVYRTAVQLTFTSELTPIETVAAFLRELSDAGLSDALYGVADQLDPPAALPVDTPTASPP